MCDTPAPLLAALTCAISAGRVTAREQRIREIAPRLLATATSTPNWFLLGFELVEAELDFDVRAALTTAQRLIAGAADDATPGAMHAATALAALSMARLEGLSAAADLVRRSTTPPPADTGPAMRTHYLLARSRTAAIAQDWASELTLAIEARAAASSSGDAVLAARAALILHDASRGEDADTERTTLNEARARVEAARVTFLDARLLFAEHFFNRRAGHAQEANRLIDAMEKAALAAGNRRFEGLAQVRRGRFAYHRYDHDVAVRAFRAARTPFQLLGDRIALAHAIEFEADVEVRRDLVRAAELVQENLALLAGRSLPACDTGIANTRLKLAVEQRDSDLAMEMATQIERSNTRTDLDERRHDEVRERLARAEAERVAAEADLRAEHVRARDRARLTWVLGSLGVAVVLGAFALVTLRSRRKLLAVNVNSRKARLIRLVPNLSRRSPRPGNRRRACACSCRRTTPPRRPTPSRSMSTRSCAACCPCCALRSAHW